MAPSQATREVPRDDPVVLVVEDDVLIRVAAAHHLRTAGFDVFEAATVDEAVTILAAERRIEVLFCDIVLIGARNGFDLLAIARRDFPHVQVLFTSGIVTADELAEKGIPFLRKPYFLFEVERQIRSLISAGHANES